jgi:two-component system, cell cycle sensor histidine kinase and response regulator CckA
MTIGNIVLQSAGSFSVGVVALMMMILQGIALIRKPGFTLYGWSMAISLSAMLYAIGIFLEYNMPPGPINRAAGLLELTAVIFLIHSLYGFTFAYFSIDANHYHLIAGIFHTAVVMLLWLSDVLVSNRFVSRHFGGMAQPFVELDMGPLGFLFVLYAVLAALVLLAVWTRHKDLYRTSKPLYMAGIIFWTVLGIHDGFAAMGMPAYQYLMEYGFLGFSMIALWIVFYRFYETESENKYRMITEFANDAIVVIQDGRTVFANPACATLIGRPVIDMAFESFLEMVVAEDRDAVSQYDNRSAGLTNQPELLTVRINRADGEDIITEIRANTIYYRRRPAVLAVLRDVTQRIREERALRENEEKIARLRKMESLGLLAGGVAHDLNNVLSGIINYPDVMLLKLPEDSPLRKPILTMQQSGKRAAAVVQDLLTVARGVAVEKRPLDLNKIVNIYLKSPEQSKLLKSHSLVSVAVDLDPRLLPIKGSFIHLGKVVMNLVSNAAEAIEGSGNISVSTANRYLDRPLRGYHDVEVGEYVVLAVSDNGPGISADDLKRIFEPFYTKKVMGRSGTGLGLALVWNVVQDHSGYIDVTTGRHGTRFEIYFPITREKVADETVRPSLNHFFGRGQTILVVDDVASQREITCEMLEQLGYRSDAVSSGEAAVDYVRDRPVDLLVLDMIMDPGIDGQETYEQVKKIRPDQKAIIVSGFAETQQVKKAIELGAGQYLKKPLTLEEFARAIKSVLD